MAALKFRCVNCNTMRHLRDKWCKVCGEKEVEVEDIPERECPVCKGTIIDFMEICPSKVYPKKSLIGKCCACGVLSALDEETERS